MFDKDTAIPCIVELMGHQRIAGMVREETVAGSAFLRVDVPALDQEPAFSKLFSGGAVYAITPTNEATMLLAVRSFRSVPIQRYELNIPQLAPRITEPGDFDDEDDEPGNLTEFGNGDF